MDHDRSLRTAYSRQRAQQRAVPRGTFLSTTVQYGESVSRVDAAPCGDYLTGGIGRPYRDSYLSAATVGRRRKPPLVLIRLSRPVSRSCAYTSYWPVRFDAKRIAFPSLVQLGTTLLSILPIGSRCSIPRSMCGYLDSTEERRVGDTTDGSASSGVLG